MNAAIQDVAIALPDRVISNEEICEGIGGWTPAKIEKKLGIVSRHVLGPDETPVDLAVASAEALFEKNPSFRAKVDYLIFCTQSPDFLLPTSACLIQDRLGLSRGIGAVDINQGCSGYVYGLSLAKALVDSGIASNALLLTADAYSKLVGPNDPGTKTIFGDAGTATLITDSKQSETAIGPFVFGTDGGGAESLIVHNSGMRGDRDAARAPLFMDGPAVLNFTLREVPPLFEQLLGEAGLARDDLDFVVLHQANKFLLDQLRRKLDVDPDKLIVDFGDVGNTVSSTIPIVLHRAMKRGTLRPGQTLALLGFGVGLSWAGCIIRI